MESANAMRTPLQDGTVPVYKKPSVRRSAVRKQEAIQTFTLPVTSVQKFSNFHEGMTTSAFAMFPLFFAFSIVASFYLFIPVLLVLRRARVCVCVSVFVLSRSVG